MFESNLKTSWNFQNYFTDKHIDLGNYMKKADQQGATITRFIYKFMLYSGPTSIFVSCIGSVIYNKLKYGHIDSDNLYRNFRFLYVLCNQNNKFQFSI